MNICKVTAIDCYLLRESTLRPNQPKKNWIFEADNDARSLHMAVKEGENIIAIVSILPETHDDCPNHPWRLRGMAVKEHLQRQGVGKQLLDVLLAMVEEGVWCTARTEVHDFYLKNCRQSRV